jgi:futalosine hydrolase
VEKRKALPEDLIILVPTAMERSILASLLPETVVLHPVGFGPISAGVEATRLFCAMPDAEREKNIVMAGIAGTYDPVVYPPGMAVSFRSVAMWGIGAGPENDFVMPGDAGLESLALAEGIPGSDPVPLVTDERWLPANLLLTVSSAAATAEQVTIRRARFPDATCEDMEGYAVAIAARRAGMKLTIIRGISNVAGDRDKSRWVIRESLAAVAAMIGKLRGDRHSY